MGSFNQLILFINIQTPEVTMKNGGKMRGNPNPTPWSPRVQRNTT